MCDTLGGVVAEALLDGTTPTPTPALSRGTGSKPTLGWRTGSCCGMAPTWLRWLPSSPAGSASCHTPVAAWAKASTSPQKAASQPATVSDPGRAWGHLGRSRLILARWELLCLGKEHFNAQQAPWGSLGWEKDAQKMPASQGGLPGGSDTCRKSVPGEGRGAERRVFKTLG